MEREKVRRGSRALIYLLDMGNLERRAAAEAPKGRPAETAESGFLVGGERADRGRRRNWLVVGGAGAAQGRQPRAPSLPRYHLPALTCINYDDNLTGKTSQQRIMRGIESGRRHWTTRRSSPLEKGNGVCQILGGIGKPRRARAGRN